MLERSVSHYRIVDKLGEGGMGVVYKAQDTRLDRFVAIKFLPQAMVADSERKHRFVQEAKAASALNHPNIITIYDIDHDQGADFIAMEYVEGKTLAELIPHHGMKLSDVLKYALQISDALARAHAKGIVHRDLKPTNVMVSRDGLVKVLDFGLAKLAETEVGDDSADTRSVSIEGAQTMVGRIFGTPAYMSPEQAAGQKVDARSDIFSFGSMLFEMVTGRRAFQGNSLPSTLAAIIRDESDLLDVDAPRDLIKILQLCLKKDPQRRIQHMADIKVMLEDLREDWDSGNLVSTTPVPPRRNHLWLLAAGFVTLVLGAFIWWRFFYGTAETPGPTSATVPFTAFEGRELHPAFSYDGNQVAFVWGGEKDDNADIYVKLIGGGRPLRLTTDRAGDYSPEWSPDGRHIAFCRQTRDGAEILLVPALGGPERRLGQASVSVFRTIPVFYRTLSLSFSPDGKWLALPDRELPSERTGIFLLSTETGEKRRLTSPPPDYDHDREPVYSPDGRHLAFIRSRLLNVSDIWVVELGDDDKVAGEPRRITMDQRWVEGLDWASDGRSLVFSSDRGGSPNLWRIDLPSGRPQPLGIGWENANHPSISRLGARLVYEKRITDINLYRLHGPAFIAIREPTEQTVFSRLAASTQEERDPHISADGKKIGFLSLRSGLFEIWMSDSDGSNPVQLASFGGPQVGTPRFSPDGRQVVFDTRKDGHADLYLVASDGGPVKRLTAEPSDEVRPSWSQDGHWVYFGSNRTGDWQVWKVRVDGGESVQITKKGGREARESFDGKLVYYAKLNYQGIWQVPAEGGEEIQAVTQGGHNYFDVLEKGICILDPGARPGPSFEFFDFSTRRLVRLASLPGNTQFGSGPVFSVSRDGRWIVYSQVDHDRSDIMLVENFR